MTTEVARAFTPYIQPLTEPLGTLDPVTRLADPWADSTTDPLEIAQQAAKVIAGASNAASHDIAVVLGSGWREAADLMGEVRAAIPNGDVPGFAPAAVDGHDGHIRSVAIAGDPERRALVFGTRTHLYEGRGPAAVAHTVRTAAAAGCTSVVLTNGCGSLRPQWTPGTPVLIADHLNLTGATPLVGPAFVDLTDAWSPGLRALARGIDPTLEEGVYAQFPGPQYETPAEVRMAGVLGADLVGMSTALEAIAARHVGLEVLGISLVTNAAAGHGAPLAHDEVIATGQAAAQRCGSLLSAIVTAIAAGDRA